MILDVPLPLFIRPHLPVHSLLPKVTIEVVRQQLGCGHRPSVLRVIAGEFVAFVKVSVKNGISQNAPVEFQLPRGYARARLRVECLNEDTKTPGHDDETKAGNKKLHDSEKNGVAFVAHHSRGSFSVGYPTHSGLRGARPLGPGQASDLEDAIIRKSMCLSRVPVKPPSRLWRRSNAQRSSPPLIPAAQLYL